MIDDRDPLELELEAMTPRELPQDVRRRIGQALVADSRSNRSTTRWWLGGLVAVAASVAVAVLAWHMRASRGIDPRSNAPDIHELATAPMHNATLGSYKTAFARSSDRFDALLDKEAARPLATADGDSRTFRPLDLNLIP